MCAVLNNRVNNLGFQFSSILSKYFSTVLLGIFGEELRVPCLLQYGQFLMSDKNAGRSFHLR